MKNSILYFFLLILKVFSNPILNIIYKYGRFFKVLLEKNFKLVLNKKVNLVLFFLYLILLLLKVDPIV